MFARTIESREFLFLQLAVVLLPWSPKECEAAAWVVAGLYNN